MYGHEDLIDNIWQNLGEDADQDGHTLEYSGGQWVFDPGDLDGADDDQNGFVDDLIGWDFWDDDNMPDAAAHGTLVAGVAVAQTHNSKGIAGIAGGWDNIAGSRLMILRHAGGSLIKTQTIAAIEYAMNNGANVMNMSFKYDEHHTEIAEAIQDAAAMDIVMVCSAGNDGGTGQIGAAKVIKYPAAYLGTISVGATMMDDSRWEETGKKGSMVGDINGQFGFPRILDVMAPGPGSASVIRSTQSNGGYGNFGEASAAAPHVTGIVALIISVNDDLAWQDVRDILRTTADKVNGPDYSDEYGYGRVDAYAALKYTLENYGGALSGEVTLTETLDIQPGNTLTIAPGATVRIQGSSTNLIVRQGANLVAVGTPSEPILFTSAEANPGRKSWRHVWLYGSNNRLEHCTFEYGNIFYIYGYPSASSGNVVKNCTFRYFDHGLHVQQSTVTIENVTLEDNRHAFVFHNNADVTIDGALGKPPGCPPWLSNGKLEKTPIEHSHDWELPPPREFSNMRKSKQSETGLLPRRIYLRTDT